MIYLLIIYTSLVIILTLLISLRLIYFTFIKRTDPIKAINVLKNDNFKNLVIGDNIG